MFQAEIVAIISPVLELLETKGKPTIYISVQIALLYKISSISSVTKRPKGNVVNLLWVPGYSDIKTNWLEGE